jgi:hypothetical protein
MKIFGRQDALLISALATALVIVFSSSISHGLDYAREIERQSGLSLMPALVVLVGAFFFHQYRRNHQQQAKAEAAMLATKDAEHRAEELERLDEVLGGVGWISEDRLEVWIGGEGRRGIGAEGADVDTLAHILEQPRERDRPLVHRG